MARATYCIPSSIKSCLWTYLIGPKERPTAEAQGILAGRQENEISAELGGGLIW